MLFAFVGTQYILDWETLIFKIWVLGKHLFLLSCNNTQWKEHSPSLSDPCTRVHTHTRARTHTHTHTLAAFLFLFPLHSLLCTGAVSHWPNPPRPPCLWSPHSSLRFLRWAGKAGPLLFLLVYSLSTQLRGFFCSPSVSLFPLSSQDSWSRFRERGLILYRSTVDLQCFSYTAKWFCDVCVCVCVCVCVYTLCIYLSQILLHIGYYKILNTVPCAIQ